MITVFYVFLLTFLVLLSGCRRPSQPSKEKAPVESVERIPDKKAHHMIQIDNLTLTEKTLTLDYQVSNPFEYDIWVCEDIDIKGKYDVETRIDAEAAWIKLLLNLEGNILRNPEVVGKYRRLQPGESYSGIILLNLPIRNASPVYEFFEHSKEHKQILVHRVVFEVGYFEGELINKISEETEKIKRDTPDEEFRKLHIEPLIVEEIQNGRSLKFLYATYDWPKQAEKSAKVDISDVHIPCSVVFDDEKI